MNHHQRQQSHRRPARFAKRSENTIVPIPLLDSNPQEPQDRGRALFRANQQTMDQPDFTQGPVAKGPPSTSSPSPTPDSNSQVQYYSDNQQGTYMAPAGTPAGAPSSTAPASTTSPYQSPLPNTYQDQTHSSSHTLVRTTLTRGSTRPTGVTRTITTPSSASNVRPTTMTNLPATTSTSAILSASSILSSTLLSIPLKSITRPVASASASGFFRGEQESTAAKHSVSGTAVAIIALFLAIAFTAAVFILRRRYLRRKARAAQLRRAQLERDYMATKESSIFGGRDVGEEQREKVSSAIGGMASGPSWISTFSDTLQVPGAINGPSKPLPSFHGRFSKRGSGWMVLGEPPSPQPGGGPSPRSQPVVRFAEDRSHRRITDIDAQSRDSAYSTATDDDGAGAVITTAERVPATGAFTKPPPTAYNSISPYTVGQMKQSPSGASYRSGTRARDPESTIVPLPTSMGGGTPSNTRVGATAGAGHGNDRLQAARARARGEVDGFRDDVSTAMARAREPLRVNKKGLAPNSGTSQQFKPTRTPSRSYHTSTTIRLSDDDDDPFVHDRENTLHIPMHAGLSPESRHSMGTLMMTNYDEDGPIEPASPLAHQDSSSSVAPRLTVTSASSKSGFIPLSQMALANAQPNYRSPTYSIYHMYDGDDEARGAGANSRKSFGLAVRSK